MTNDWSVATVVKTVKWGQKSDQITLAELHKLVDELEALAPPETVLTFSAGEDQREHDSWLRVTGVW